MNTSITLVTSKASQTQSSFKCNLKITCHTQAYNHVVITPANLANLLKGTQHVKKHNSTAKIGTVGRSAIITSQDITSVVDVRSRDPVFVGNRTEVPKSSYIVFTLGTAF